jgi:hypothetical protein
MAVKLKIILVFLLFLSSVAYSQDDSVDVKWTPLSRQCFHNLRYIIVAVPVYPVKDKLKSVAKLWGTSFCCSWLFHTSLLELVRRSRNYSQVHRIGVGIHFSPP